MIWGSQFKGEGHDGYHWQMWGARGCYALRCYIWPCYWTWTNIQFDLPLPFSLHTEFREVPYIICNGYGLPTPGPVPFGTWKMLYLLRTSIDITSTYGLIIGKFNVYVKTVSEHFWETFVFCIFISSMCLYRISQTKDDESLYQIIRIWAILSLHRFYLCPLDLMIMKPYKSRLSYRLRFAVCWLRTGIYSYRISFSWPLRAVFRNPWAPDPIPLMLANHCWCQSSDGQLIGFPLLSSDLIHRNISRFYVFWHVRGFVVLYWYSNKVVLMRFCYYSLW